MSTITPFNPPQNANFQFEPTLGGQTYTVIVTWNLFGQRWYINIFRLDGTLVLSEALIGSPNGHIIQAISWSNGTVTVTTTSPHGWEFLNTVELVVRSCVPNAYNGTVQALVINETQVQYPLAVNPGSVSVLGEISFDVNIIKNYINGSYLIYHDSLRQFEVYP